MTPDVERLLLETIGQRDVATRSALEQQMQIETLKRENRTLQRLLRYLLRCQEQSLEPGPRHLAQIRRLVG